MRDASASLWKALQSQTPVVIVLYEDAGLREELIADMKALAPAGATFRQSSDVEDAFREPGSLLFLIPRDERQAIFSLDGRRDALLERQAPVVLLLVRDGDGMRSLTEAPGLASWVQGSEVDPHHLEQIDLHRERKLFKEKTGRWPEEWLEAYRSGRIPDTLENGLWATRAGLLEEPP
jgi:hypothetical protein